jgi:hypothetical protein
MDFALTLPALAAFTHPLAAAARRILSRPRRAHAVARAPQPAPTRAPRPARAQPVRVMIRTQQDGHRRLMISGRMADVCAELERLAL